MKSHRQKQAKIKATLNGQPIATVAGDNPIPVEIGSGHIQVMSVDIEYIDNNSPGQVDYEAKELDPPANSNRNKKGSR